MGKLSLQASRIKNEIHRIRKLSIDPKFWIYLHVELSIIITLFLIYKSWNYFVDDAYIGFRHIQNFLEFGQFTFNKNEYVEGVTNIGWLLFNLPFCLLFPIPLVGKILGALFVFFTLGWLVYGIIHFKINDPYPYIFIVLPLIVSSFDFIYFSIAGLETSLLAFMLLWFVFLMSKKPWSFCSAFVGAFLFTLHPECILIYPLCIMVYALYEKNGQSFYGLAYFMFWIILLTLFRYLYYDSFLPNTFFSKSMSWTRFIGLLYHYGLTVKSNIPPPFESVFSWIIAFYGIHELIKHHFRLGVGMGVSVLVGLIFGFYAPFDWTELGRYFGPYYPLFYLCFMVGLFQLLKVFHSISPVLKTRFTMVLVCMLIYLCSFNFLRLCILLSDRYTQTYPGYVLMGENLIEPSLWIKNHVAKDAVIATRRIGFLGFYSDLYVFDYVFGLTDKHVARQIYQCGDYFNDPGDEKLKEIWVTQSPDFLLEDEQIMMNILEKSGGTKQSFFIHGIEYGVFHEFEIGKDAKWILSEKKASI